MELRIEHLTKKYGKKTALSDFSVTLQNGTYALLGPNGAGKTTLISILVGALRQTAGEIYCDGENVRNIPKKYAAQIGFMPQQTVFYKNFTAMEFLQYVGVLKDMPKAEIREKSEALLKTVNLYGDKDKKIGAFSGGMKQRLGIAQSLLNDPKLLVFDEPTAGLDPRERIRFRNIVSRLSKDRIVILSTHIVPDVDETADCVMLLKAGHLLKTDTPAALIENLRGKIWTIRVPFAQLDEILQKYRIFNINHASGEYEIRVYCEEQPLENAVPTEPRLEDVYLDAFEEVHNDAFAL